ncbi:mycofactocin biosynthesis FMN-dependent deaminase MftD [Thermomicrobium sp. 4228-Ro]|uniref:pre-mycofactocin synthase MftD n=1 Tax=Thermomicrobium sp. 4228-Ro TaxID=2993937 RepID=UPI002248A557|nr:pre-mycofactocin synthase MftD [Thermomicrobium sp. 4228-Ro]MCX2727862.1 mycofactocin biosynthesis FMN-dependent deaminase MftD [Thermomicrobium sp. 4228-Ro]
MASTRHWFETIAEAQRRAKKRLPRSVYDAIMAGSERGVTLTDNVAAFAEIGFLPRIAGAPPQRRLATTVLGFEIAFPVIISPTGVQAVHPDAEVAVARAAAAAGTIMILSSFASKPLEEVVAANPRTFFQIYWLGTRQRIRALLDRAKAAGACGIVVTLDWSFATRRDWESPFIPDRLTFRNMLRLAPEALARPGWLWQYLKRGKLPDLTVPNLAQPGQRPPTFFEAYFEWMQTPPPTWEDIAWLRKQWDGPFVIKGVLHPEDARRAVDIGADAISVSNHGGNNLDSAPATIRVLPTIVEAVGDRIEILLDGGIRRGSDVVKALALGARAVLIGRAYLWGLAANGEAGVRNVLELLRSGIDETLLGLGKASVHDLCPDDLIIPPGFALGPSAAVAHWRSREPSMHPLPV